MQSTKNIESLGEFILPFQLLGYASNKDMIEELEDDYMDKLQQWNKIIRKAQAELDKLVDRSELTFPRRDIHKSLPVKRIIRIKKRSNN